MAQKNADTCSLKKVNLTHWKLWKKKWNTTKIWILSLKSQKALNIVKKRSNLGVPVAQDLPLENASFSKFASKLKLYQKIAFSEVFFLVSM